MSGLGSRVAAPGGQVCLDLRRHPWARVGRLEPSGEQVVVVGPRVADVGPHRKRHGSLVEGLGGGRAANPAAAPLAGTPGDGERLGLRPAGEQRDDALGEARGVRLVLALRPALAAGGLGPAPDRVLLALLPRQLEGGLFHERAPALVASPGSGELDDDG